MKIKRIITLMLSLSLFTSCLTGCKQSYREISPKEAKEIMEKEKNFIILDVRTHAEFSEGHIPNAVCFPNEDITVKDITSTLPDKNQLILVYCRSGRRSKEAAKKLLDLGYTKIVEFGGIIDWPYEITK